MPTLHLCFTVFVISVFTLLLLYYSPGPPMVLLLWRLKRLKLMYVYKCLPVSVPFFSSSFQESGGMNWQEGGEKVGRFLTWREPSLEQLCFSWCPTCSCLRAMSSVTGWKKSFNFKADVKLGRFRWLCEAWVPLWRSLHVEPFVCSSVKWSLWPGPASSVWLLNSQASPASSSQPQGETEC